MGPDLSGLNRLGFSSLSEWEKTRTSVEMLKLKTNWWWFRGFFFRVQSSQKIMPHTAELEIEFIQSADSFLREPSQCALAFFSESGIFHLLRARRSARSQIYIYIYFTFHFHEHDCAIIAEKTENSLRAWDRLMGFMNLAHLNENPSAARTNDTPSSIPSCQKRAMTENGKWNGETKPFSSELRVT